MTGISLVMGVIASAGVASCTLGAKGTEREPLLNDSIALFDFFEYRGNDDIYKANPLSDKSEFYSLLLPGSYPDPSICSNGKGDYFLATSTFVYYPGVPLFHSRDLVNWRQVGHILDRPSQLVNMEGQHVSGGIFAPDIAYNPYNNTYYMITTNVGVGNFFVKTTDPYGSWSDPILLPEVKGIDPSFFFDEDGSAYIINSDDAPDNKPEYDGHRTIRIQKFDTENDCTTGDRIIIANKGTNPETNPIWMEGPHMYKINGYYYLMTAEGGTGGWHSEVIFRGESPMGPFKAWSKNPILTQRHLDSKRPNPVTCVGHADLVKAHDSKEWWAVCLGCRPDFDRQFENLGRETYLLPVKWSDDGFPFVTQGDDVLPMISKREGVVRGDTVTFGNFNCSDSFDAPVRGLEWMTLRGDAHQLYSLEDYPGYLSLKCTETSACDKLTPAFMCRRIQHHKFNCSTRLLFDPKTTGQKAGLLLFKDEAHQYFMAVEKKGDTRCLSLLKISDKGSEVLARHDIGNGSKDINLSIESSGDYFTFRYSVGCDDKWKSLAEKIDAIYLSSNTAGGFTGTTIGLYATSSNDI